eukprot:1383690-Prymnesium_polylepis.1
MSANSRGQPAGLPASRLMSPHAYRDERGQSEPFPALPERRTASSDGAKAMYGGPEPDHIGCRGGGSGGYHGGQFFYHLLLAGP